MICLHYAWIAHLRPEEGLGFSELEPPELELLKVLSHPIGAGNRIRALWKNNQCSYLLSHVSPRFCVLKNYFECCK